MFLVQCPGCGQQMKTRPRKKVKDSVKRCVYCGKSFKIHCNVNSSRIVTQVPR